MFDGANLYQIDLSHRPQGNAKVALRKTGATDFLVGSAARQLHNEAELGFDLFDVATIEVQPELYIAWPKDGLAIGLGLRLSFPLFRFDFAPGGTTRSACYSMTAGTTRKVWSCRRVQTHVSVSTILDESTIPPRRRAA